MKGRENIFEFERYLIPGDSPGKNFQKYASSSQVIWGRGVRWGGERKIREMQTSLKIV